MVKTVSIADYQAARSLDDQGEREPFESIAERLQRLGVRSQAAEDMPLGEIKGLVRDAAEEAGILAGTDEINAEAERIWTSFGSREHTYTVDASGEVRDWRAYAPRPAEPAADEDGEAGVTHHRITDDEPRFSGAGASDGEAQQQSMFLIPSDGQFNGKLYRAAPELANIAERLIAEQEAAEAALDTPTWPHVLAFARRMEAKLDENRHKGNREGWLTEEPIDLLARLVEEVVELQHAIDRGWPTDDVASEAADVANFALMVADSYRNRRGGER